MNKENTVIENTWKGSNKTFSMVYQQIAERYGESEASNFDPETNCHTMNDWNKKGMKIKKGEKALKSITYVTPKKKGEENNNRFNEREEKKIDNGKRVYTYKKVVNLYYYLQVEKMSEKFKKFLAEKKKRQSKKGVK